MDKNEKQLVKEIKRGYKAAKVYQLKADKRRAKMEKFLFGDNPPRTKAWWQFWKYF